MARPARSPPDFDRGVDNPVWAADGRSIFVSYEDRGSVSVARIGLDGSRRVVAEGLTGAALDRPYAGGAFSVSRNGAVAVTLGSATRPSDIALVSGGAPRRLTRLNAELLDTKALGEVRRITVPSSLRSAPDRRLADPAARLSRGAALSAHPRNPWRAVRRLRPQFLDRQPALCRRRLCRRLGQSARLDLLRAGIRQPHPPCLSRQRL